MSSLYRWLYAALWVFFVALIFSGGDFILRQIYPAWILLDYSFRDQILWLFGWGMLALILSTWVKNSWWRSFLFSTFFLSAFQLEYYPVGYPLTATWPLLILEYLFIYFLVWIMLWWLKYYG